MVHGQATQFILSNKPFAYLGVRLTMNLNWKHKHIHLTDYLKGSIEGSRASHASSRQAHDVIHKAIIPGLACHDESWYQLKHALQV